MKLAIFIQHQKVVCYHCDPAGQWERRHIKGETSVDIPPDKAAVVLRQIITDQSDLINQQHALRDVEIHLIYGVADVGAMAEAPKILAELQCITWQILRLEPLLERAAVARGLTQALPLDGDDKWLRTVLLPILASTFAYSNQAFQAEEARARHEHEETMDTLRADIAHLHHEKANLQTQVQALQVPDMERLLVFFTRHFSQLLGRGATG